MTRRFNTEIKAPGINWIGDWVDPRADLYAVAFSLPGTEPRPFPNLVEIRLVRSVLYQQPDERKDNHDVCFIVNKVKRSLSC
jgi:hypothetical protein